MAEVSDGGRRREDVLAAGRHPSRVLDLAIHHRIARSALGAGGDRGGLVGTGEVLAAVVEGECLRAGDLPSVPDEMRKAPRAQKTDTPALIRALCTSGRECKCAADLAHLCIAQGADVAMQKPLFDRLDVIEVDHGVVG